jgi:hypothetical protein
VTAGEDRDAQDDRTVRSDSSLRDSTLGGDGRRDARSAPDESTIDVAADAGPDAVSDAGGPDTLDDALSLDAADAATAELGLDAPRGPDDAGFDGPWVDTGPPACVDASGDAPGCPTGSACTADGGAGTCCGGGCCAGACCGSSCVDLQTDPNNCGACGSVVPKGAGCSGGVPWVSSCAGAALSVHCTTDGGPGLCCGGQCIGSALDDDVFNCGQCGTACATGARCTAYGCTASCSTPADCPTGYDLCSEGPYGPYAPKNCYRSVCDAGSRGVQCEGSPAKVCCGTSCLDVESDPDNCGGCGIACDPDQYCSQGVCLSGVTCTLAAQGEPCVVSPGKAGACCSGACVDVNRDTSNCSGCGYSCPSPTRCSGGLCYFPGDGGPPALGLCVADGVHRTFSCPAGTTCNWRGAMCVADSCSSVGESVCDGPYTFAEPCCSVGPASCPTLTNDPQNCGACGNVCTSGLCLPFRYTGQCFPAPRCADDCSSLGGCPTGTTCAAGYCVEPATACAYTDTDGPLCATPGGQLGICCGSYAPVYRGCVDPLNDPRNCGGCGVVCKSGACRAGVCEP